MTSFELIEKLCQCFGPTGCECGVAELIKKEISDICPNAGYDRMGNLIATMRFGNAETVKRHRIMVCAHMDEVGFMITEIKENGYLGFDALGGISDEVIAGRRVKVLARSGELISGVIASKAIHHKEKDKRQTPTPINELYIDIGATDKAQAEELVRIGDFVTFDSEFYAFGDGYVKGKALDDRMGCAAMIEVMRLLSEKPLEYGADVFFCFTVREEIGLSGARVAAFEIRPSAAIVLETTAVADVVDVAPSRRVADTGGGVVVSLMDRSTVYSREMTDMAFDVAKRQGIAAQVKRYVSGGNDAGSIHKEAEGVKTVALSVPTRYLHSPACVARMDDYIAQRELCEQMIRELASGELD